VPVQEFFCSALAALVGPVQNIFFLTVHYFNFLSPSPSKLGRQSCWVACLFVFFSANHIQNKGNWKIENLSVFFLSFSTFTMVEKGEGG
jgi:hypothetical protein